MQQTETAFRLLSSSHVRPLILLVFAADVVLVSAYLVFFLHGNPLGNDSPGLFNLDMEGNIPSWYSSIKLLAVALCAFFLGRLVFTYDRLAGAAVLIGAAIFAYLSMDEGSAIHERIGDKTDLLLTDGVGPTGTMFEVTGLWMLFLAPPLFVALIAGVVFLRKRLSIPTSIFVKAVLGIVVFIVAAAIGDIFLNYVTGDGKTIQIAFEEYGEMTGVTLILWAVMSLLARENAVVVGGVAERARSAVTRSAAPPRHAAGAGGQPASLHRHAE